MPVQYSAYCNREHREGIIMSSLKQKLFVADQGGADQWAPYCSPPGPLDSVIFLRYMRPRLELAPVVSDDMAVFHWLWSTGQSPQSLVVVGVLSWW